MTVVNRSSLPAGAPVGVVYRRDPEAAAPNSLSFSGVRSMNQPFPAASTSSVTAPGSASPRYQPDRFVTSNLTFWRVAIWAALRPVASQRCSAAATISFRSSRVSVLVTMLAEVANGGLMVELAAPGARLLTAIAVPSAVTVGVRPARGAASTPPGAANNALGLLGVAAVPAI